MTELHPDVERAIRRATRRDPRVLRKAAYATTIVEARGQNPRHGHLDSLGSFQQRPSQGWGTPEQVMNPSYAARKFAQAARRILAQNPGMDSAELAQAVQRSAFPDRYAAPAVQAQAQRLSRSAGAGGTAPNTLRLPGRMSTDVSLTSRTIPGQSFAAERTDARRELLMGDITMDKLLEYKGTIKSLKDVPARKVPGDLQVKRTQAQDVRVPIRGRDVDSVAPAGSGRIYEVFYDPMGEYWDSGGLHRGAIGGHGTHIHVAGDPKYLVRLGRFAQQMGLDVGEQSAFGGTPTGGHTEGSFHYEDKAIDVSGGTPAKRRKFARIVLREARRGRGR